MRIRCGSVSGGLCLALLVPLLGARGDEKASEANIIKHLVGKWSMEMEVDKVKVKAVFQYKQDGTFKAEISSAADNKVTAKDIFAGRWRVTGGAIQTTLTEVNAPANPRLKVGAKSTERVVAISATTLKKQELKDDGTPLGKEMVLQRVKD